MDVPQHGYMKTSGGKKYHPTLSGKMQGQKTASINDIKKTLLQNMHRQIWYNMQSFRPFLTPSRSTCDSAHRQRGGNGRNKIGAEK